MLTLEQLLERVLALPEAEGDARGLLEAFRNGDRSQELAERLRVQFRSGGAFSGRNPPPALLAIGWAAAAALNEIGGPSFDSERDAAIRWAAEALVEHERNQMPTVPCGPPDEADVEDTDEPLWASDPAAQPAGRC